MAIDLRDQTLKLSDNRILGYSVYGGPLSPDVPVIFYFHGFPGSRIEAELCKSQKFAATVVAIDRPGMGLSSFQPGRRILDWPSDVLAVADHLKIQRFHVVGDSGGAPYALVCAKQIPRTRLMRTAVVSGVYPMPTIGTSEMLLPIRVMIFASAWLPTFALKKFLDLEFGNAIKNPDPEVFEKMFMKAMDNRAEKDRRCLDDKRIKDIAINSTREAFREGSKGPAWDFGLVTDWGFKLEEMDGTDVVLWHGKKDVNTPFGAAKKAASDMKGCELKAFEDETHLSLPLSHMEEIMEALLG